MQLTKEIYQLLFNKDIPNNLQICEQMKSQFNETFPKLMGLTNGLRSNKLLLPQKGEVKTLQGFIKTTVLHTQRLLLFSNIKLYQEFNLLLPKSLTNHLLHDLLPQNHHTNLLVNLINLQQNQLLITPNPLKKKNLCLLIIQMTPPQQHKERKIGEQQSLWIRYGKSKGLTPPLVKH